MKKFRFRLASVLEIRKKRQQDALVGLAAAQKAYQDAVARKRDLLDGIAKAFARKEALGQGVTPALGFQLEQDFIIGNRHRIVQAEQGIMRATRGVEKALRVYLFARKQTRMIEVLEEKEIADYRRERARDEQKKLDELVTMRARFRQDQIL